MAPPEHPRKHIGFPISYVRAMPAAICASGYTDTKGSFRRRSGAGQCSDMD
jgi:hypothetical protein